MNVFQSQLHHTYFVYGSNMHPEQIAQRCGSPVALGAARVVDHRLAFFGHTSVWDGGEEAVVPEAGEEVWGMLYRMTFEQADKLDEWQGVRPDGCGPYFLFPVFAVGLNGISQAALLYRRDLCSEPTRPSDAQRDFIVAAARAQGLPEAYIDRLNGLDVTKAKYRVPRLEGRERWRSILRCTGCD